MDLSRRSFISTAITGRPSGSQKTLVWVFLRGGADMLNVVVPHGDDLYYKLRPTIAIPRPSMPGGAIRLDDFYGFHPKLAPLVPLHQNGRLAIIQSVGSDNPTGSHFEAQDQMEHGESFGKSIGGGWLGRHLRTRPGKEATPFSAVAIAPTLPESLRGAITASAIESLDEFGVTSPGGDAGPLIQALSRMYSPVAGKLSAPARETLKLVEQIDRIRKAGYSPEGGAAYPADGFGLGLREIARLIKAEVGLEVAAIDLGGWDTHFFQGSSTGQQADLIDTLARGLAALDTDLARYRDRLVIAVMTEFGRRAYENTSLGTDHGRGFAMIVIADGINGGRVIGNWPGLAEEEPWPGPGGLKINYDYRSVLGEVLSGLLGNQNISSVFPGLGQESVGLVNSNKSRMDSSGDGHGRPSD
jgi:uncharacterized protein (DUF1501 family)